MRRVDNASLTAFRILFGALMFFSTVRFLFKGWVYDFYIKPTAFFSFAGFSWVQPWPPWGMYLHFSILALLALMVACGLYYRVAIVFFFLGFTYVELIDKTNYLNHYYFISLISCLMIFLPLHRRFSLDVWRNPSRLLMQSHPWPLWVLRIQVGMVYFFAGIAKLNPDWLFHGQPLKIWLASRSDFPGLGFLFLYPASAMVMSWVGMLFDLTVPFLLLWRRTRAAAYIFLVVFHLLTYRLFNIGVFPWVMIFSALIFFPPDWPVRLMKFCRFGKTYRGRDKEFVNASDVEKFPCALMLFFALFFLIQAVVPLRHWFYPGSVLWHEQGFRFSWRVMLMEKTGSLDYRVRDPRSNRVWEVNPREYWQPLQVKQMSTQPDMILQGAYYLKDQFARRGYPDVEVRADTMVSLNGRPGEMLIDPQVDLTQVRRKLFSTSFILPFSHSPAP